MYSYIYFLPLQNARLMMLEPQQEEEEEEEAQEEQLAGSGQLTSYHITVTHSVSQLVIHVAQSFS